MGEAGASKADAESEIVAYGENSRPDDGWCVSCNRARRCNRGWVTEGVSKSATGEGR